MKKYYLFASFVLLAASPAFAQTKIGGAGAPDGSAMLEVTSGTASNKGLLLPKLTTAQRNAITSPATGLMIYNTTTNEAQVNTGTSASPIWTVATATSTGWNTTGNTGTTPATNFIGTTDNQPLAIRTNNTEKVSITSGGNVGIGIATPGVKLQVRDTGDVTMLIGTPVGNRGHIALGNTNHGLIRGLEGSGGEGNDIALYTSAGNAVGASLYLVSDPLVSNDSLPLNQFVLRQTGNIGIGTNTPAARLHLNDGNLTITNNGPIASSAISIIADSANGGDADNINITTYGFANPLFGISAARGTAAAPLNSQSGDNIGGISFGARVNGTFTSASAIRSTYLGDSTNLKSRLTFGVSGTTVMTIDSSGFMGIGVATPQQDLHVQGTARITGSSGTATTIAGRNAVGDISNLAIGTGLSLTGGTLTATAGGNNWGLTGNTGSNPTTNFIGTTDNQAIIVRTNNTEKARVTAAGDVGIGTNAPAAKLHVDNGNLTISNSGPISNSAINIISDGGGEANPDNISITSYGSSNPLVGFNIARGTKAAPLNSQVGDAIGQIAFGPRINGVFNAIAGIGSVYLGNGTTSKSRLDFTTSGVNAMVIDSSGYVGIGTIDPAYKLDVVGDINASANVRANGVALTSDARLKRNISKTQQGLSAIMKLNPVEYEKKKSIKGNEYNRHEIGFIAQEIAKVLPSLVTEGKDADKTLAVSYTELIPVLTKAIQEQQAQIEALKAENKELKESNKITAQLMERVKQMEQMMGINEIEGTSKVAGK